MNKLFFLALIAFLLLPSVFSETVFERSFGEMGYEGMLVEGTQKKQCQEISFVFPEVWAEGQKYEIASIGLEFGPAAEGKADVNASLNGKVIAELSLEDFKCSSSKCWERLALPAELLKAGENSLETCLRTGNSVTSMKLLNESMVGIYQTADFSGEDAFRTEAEKTRLVRGEKTRISILLHNQGSGSANARIEYARPVAEDKNAFWVVEGDAYFDGIVEPGQTVEISYVVKPRLSTQMTLPPAIVYYENEFGEIEQKFGNLVVLHVREPDRKIEAFIVKKEEQAFVGQNLDMQLAVKNVGNEPLYELTVETEGQPSISQALGEIAELRPKETVYLPLSVSSQEAGKFEVGCTITYHDLDLSEASCLNSFVEFKEQEVSYTLYIALAFVVIAGMVYVYLMKG
jgi:hypothetical protein